MSTDSFSSARLPPRHDLKQSTDSFSSARLPPRDDLKQSTDLAGGGPGRAPGELLRRLRLRHAADPVTHVERVPARAGEP
ncbi:hypothetical protein, partial [Micromonospora sp. MH33]|uniref:hypothetical protein n=1 Tax=Micromonospora sp. MH33 TaxID=1945509 RepID=UPI0011B1EB1E